MFGDFLEERVRVLTAWAPRASSIQCYFGIVWLDRAPSVSDVAPSSCVFLPSFLQSFLQADHFRQAPWLWLLQEVCCVQMKNSQSTMESPVVLRPRKIHRLRVQHSDRDLTRLYRRHRTHVNFLRAPTLGQLDHYPDHNRGFLRLSLWSHIALPSPGIFREVESSLGAEPGSPHFESGRGCLVRPSASLPLPILSQPDFPLLVSVMKSKDHL